MAENEKTATIINKKNIDKIRYEEIFLDEKPKRRDFLLKTLVKNTDFNNILRKHGLSLGETVDKGGFGVVYRCSGKFSEDGVTTDLKDSVLKLSSYKCLSDTDGGEWFGTAVDDNELNAQVVSFYMRERYVYDLFDDDVRKNMAAPFRIIVYCPDEQGVNQIYDFVFCVNMPEYKEITEVIGKEYTEETILRIVYDVLGQLKKAHLDGTRHRDIKLENIMYDEKNEKYVLVDWGSSCRVSDNEADKFIYNKNRGEAYTPVYVDPLRFGKDENLANAVTTDLYSLGVFIVYMLHEKGYKAGNNIIGFYNEVCPDVKMQNGKPMLSPEIYTDLFKENNGNGKKADIYRRIRSLVSKSMNHNDKGYEDATSMFVDVGELLGVSKERDLTEEDETEKPVKRKVKKIAIKPLYSIFPALFVTLYTMLVSGIDGLRSVISGTANVSASLLSVVLCLLLPFLIIGKISKNNDKHIDVELKTFKSAVIGLISVFVVMNLPVAVVLGNLRISYPLLFNCIQMIILGVTCIVAEKYKYRKIVIRGTGCAVSGLMSGCSVVVCIGGNVQNSGLIIITTVITGIVLSLAWNYCEFLYKTRLKKINSNF